ncbi:MAG: DNA polymerase [Opitutae bacterium]|nr:DNA polymerase [Opitutae bacterium]
MIIPGLDPSHYGSICGIWVADDGQVHLAVAEADGRRRECTTTLRPFVWIDGLPVEGEVDGLHIERLKGEGAFTRLAHADSFETIETVQEMVGKGKSDTVRPLESQFLLQHRARLYADMHFGQLRRCQLDIETASAEGHFSDAARPEDRVLAIGLRCGGCNRLLVLAELTDAAEKQLLEELNAVLAEEDPDVIEGHNLFKFDLDYLRQRAKRHGVPCAWGRFGQTATFRPSRLKVAERWIDFPRCDLPGRAVVDTYLLVQLYDISTRELTAYGLKDVALHFGITEEHGTERTYIAGAEIFAAYRQECARFLAYLGDDLRETQGLADLLLPTYFEQTKTFPILLQEATLRGTTTKIDLLFLEEYYHGRHACPVPPEIKPFEGGYTRSFQAGVFKHVLHFDVASLYPSLLLHIGRNPKNDPLGVFIPLLRSLREYRLRFKQLARSAPDPETRAEAQARQASFKILINSFYGYLGFSGARFGDGELAAEVTRLGRELLQLLIDEFTKHGCTILEADTDGIYLSSDRHFTEPEALLALVAPVLPAGIELEYDGRYTAMFCYKAKNYALCDGHKIILRGSALRSRGIEPFLRQLTDHAIRFLLGMEDESPLKLYEQLHRRIRTRDATVDELAKTETLSQNAEAYQRFIAEGGKPRRAAAEAALQQTPLPRMGDRITYYIGPKAKGQSNDWQRARLVSLFDSAAAPYDPEYYLKKLDDWLERYGPFLGLKPATAQEELDFG